MLVCRATVKQLADMGLSQARLQPCQSMHGHARGLLEHQRDTIFSYIYIFIYIYIHTDMFIYITISFQLIIAMFSVLYTCLLLATLHVTDVCKYTRMRVPTQAQQCCRQLMALLGQAGPAS